MSGRPAILKVDIVTDANTKGIDAAESRLSRFGSKAAAVGKAAAIGLGAVAVGAVAVGTKLFQMGDEADDANGRIRNIAGSMGLFGDKVDKVSSRLIKYAEATARQTGGDTNSIKATQAKLLTFGQLAASADKVGGNFDRATKAAIDMAAAGFGTAEGNAVQLGKALNDPIKGITALAKSGVTFTETEKARIATLVESNKAGAAQALVLKAIETQVGGTAKAMSGGTDRLKVTVTQLAEKIGIKLVPVVDKASAWIADKLLPAAIKAGKYLQTHLGPTFAKVGAWVSDKLVPALANLWDWFVKKIVPGIEKSVQPRIEGLKDGFGYVADAVRRNEPELRKIGNALKTVAEFIANKVMPVLGKLVGTGFRVLGAAIAAVIEGISGFVDGISWAIDKIKELIGWIGKIHFPDFPDLGSLVPGAAGGLLTIGPTLTGDSPSYDSRRGWSTAAAASSMTTALRSVATLRPGAGYVDARTFLAVQVDGAGIVDEHRVAQAIAQVLARWATRMGRPVTELLTPAGVTL